MMASLLMFAVIRSSDSLQNDIIVRAIGCKLLTHYIPFFFFGALAKIYQEQFIKLIQSQLIMTIIFIAWVVFSILEIQEEIYILKVIVPFFGIVSMFSIFYYFRETFSSQTRIGRAMSYVGKNTLPIYLLHYFFIDGLSGLHGSVLHQLVQSSWVLEIIIVMSFAIVIAIGCLFIEKTLQAVPIVHSILFGFDHKKKKL